MFHHFSDKKFPLILNIFAVGDSEFLGALQKFRKARSSLGVKVPADEHQLVVDDLRAEAGTRQSVAGCQQVEDLLAIQIGVGREVRRVTKREHLVEGDAEGPDVGFVAELAVATLERLGRVPFDGECSGVGRVVVAIVVGELRETKVGDLHAVLVGNEDIAGCEISVDDFLLLQVLHALEI